MTLTRIRVTKAAIKAYIRDLLLATDQDGTYPTLAGANVMMDRFSPLATEELPAIVVFAVEETNEKFDDSRDRRQAKIQIEVQAGGEDPMAQIDVIEAQAMEILNGDPYLGGVEDGMAESCRYGRGQLAYDERRHVNALAWVIELDMVYMFDTTPEYRPDRVTDFQGVDATYADVRTAPAIEPTGSVIDIPQP